MLLRELWGAEYLNMRAEIARSHLISDGVMIAANALMATILGILLTGGAGI